MSRWSQRLRIQFGEEGKLFQGSKCKKQAKIRESVSKASMWSKEQPTQKLASRNESTCLDGKGSPGCVDQGQNKAHGNQKGTS